MAYYTDLNVEVDGTYIQAYYVIFGLEWNTGANDFE